MITVDKKEQIRRAHYVEGKSIRQIQRKTGYHRETICKALEDGEVPVYTLQEPRRRPLPGCCRPLVSIL